jgi:kumamolisin
MPFDKYVKVPGSERQPVTGATTSGTLDPNEVMQVTVVLRPRSGAPAASLSELVAAGKHISREEYAQRYGADPADVQALADFASHFGLAIGNVNLAARTVTLAGKCSDFAHAFQVKLGRYHYKGGSYRGRTGAVNVPQELHGVVLSVHGLDNRPQAKPHFRLARAATRAAAPAATSFSPLQIAKAYSFPTSVNGKGQTIGIIELGGGYKQSDLSTYFNNLKISPAPTVLAVSVDGATNSPTGDTSGPDTEVGLDIEVCGAVAPGARIAVYFAPNTDAGFLDAINQAVMDTVNKPSVISISWGGPESSWTAQSLQSYNNALQSAAAVGVSICVASGDNGSDDGVGDGQDHVDFPASSPYALACGGTTLQISGSSISSEVVWNDQATGDGATGGGVSGTFPLPSYQANAGVPPGRNPSGFKGRGVPDVSGDADPATGYNVTVDGSSFAVGGTSAVAPLWAGLIALLNQSLGKAVCFLNPTLYQNIAETAGAFNDITSGNNGDFSAGPGWDACTGWGSPEGAKLLQALSSGASGNPSPSPGRKPKPIPRPKPKPTKKPKRGR